MLKNGRPFGRDYFDELLERIREIRASERRAYQKIADVFEQCSYDYDKNSETTRAFYAFVQNKLHFAVTGKTAAELIAEELRKIYPLPNKVTTRPTTSLGEVRLPRFPSVLLEIGYHDNYSDAVWVEGHRDAIAQQIARGLTAYFGLPFIYPMDPVQGTVTVSNGTLNLRDYPSSSGKVIASLPNGAAVTIYGEWNGWYVVHYGDQVGYAAAAYIDT